MSRRDPTLPSPETDTLPEADLISLVKTEQDSAALLALINRHTGIYFHVVNRYAASYPNAIKAQDMDDDKLFNIYQFILAYDPNRGMKLSTYISDRTDYLCKTMLKKDEHNPISAGTYAPTGAISLDRNEDTYSTNNGGHVTLQDRSPSAQVLEVVDHDIGIQDIQRAAKEANLDKRFMQILEYRHFGQNHRAMTWRDIGKNMGMSYEGARKLYFANIELVKNHLKTSP